MLFSSWITYTYLSLMIAMILAAGLVGDRRIHIGALAIVLSWVVSQLIRMISPGYSPLITEILINISVIYVFFQLHFWAEGEESGPVWPIFMMLFEIFIFLSHMTKITMGGYYYTVIVNILFATEITFMIGVCLFNRFKRSRNS